MEENFLNYLSIELKALEHTVEFFKDSANKNILKKVLNALVSVKGRIIVTGMGKAGHIGRKIAATLSSTGSPSVFVHPAEGIHGDLGMIDQEDIVLAFSKSGETKEVLSLIPYLKNSNITLLSITCSPESSLARSSDYFLSVPIKEEACPLDLAPTSSTTAFLAIGDAIALTLMDIKGFKKEDFARFHPGGSLGKRLLLKVSDLMHSGTENSIVSKNAKLEEIIVELTNKAMGGVNVINGENELLGIITDGDVRRAIPKIRSENVNILAKDLMTANPITVQDDSKAYDALKLMEDRESQISVLPVLNQERKLVGILRLHDLLNAGF